MNKEEEKYSIKPRRKYQKQAWLKDGKAIIRDQRPVTLERRTLTG